MTKFLRALLLAGLFVMIAACETPSASVSDAPPEDLRLIVSFTNETSEDIRVVHAYLKRDAKTGASVIVPLSAPYQSSSNRPPMEQGVKYSCELDRIQLSVFEDMGVDSIFIVFDYGSVVSADLSIPVQDLRGSEVHCVLTSAGATISLTPIDL